MQKVIINTYLDAKIFFKAFNDAKEFNLNAKAGKELIYAPVIIEAEDKKVEEVKKEEVKKEEVKKD